MKATEWLSIYGAVLSTIVFAWNFFQSRSRIKVRVVIGIEGKAVGAHVSVQNRSQHTVHLSSISVLYRYRKATFKDWLSHAWKFKRLPRRLGWIYSSLSNYSIESGCPVVLNARDSHHVLIPEHVLEKIFLDAVGREIVVVVQDKIWNRVHSSVFTYPVPRRTT